MGISLPIGSHLDDTQARRTANQAEDYFSRAGRQAGEGFARNVNAGLGRVDTGKARVKAEELQRAYNKAADAAGNLRKEEAKLDAVNAASNSTDAQKIAAAERVLKARRANSTAVRALTNDLRDLEAAGGSAQAVLSALNSGQELTQLGSSAAKASMDFGELASSIAAVAGPVGIGALVGGAAYGAITVMGALGSAAVELTGALGLLPGAAVAAGAAFGTMKIATMGFSDALDTIGKSLQDFKNPKAFADDQKKFAEDLQSLSPNAQQAALAINAMVPAFYQLKNATQDALFSGVGQELNRLANTYLPSIQNTLVSIASSFNSMFKGVADELMTPATQKAIQETLANISQAFRNLAPAMGPATKAFAEIANVSSSFLPGLASAISGAAQSFSKFIDEASKSGQLHQWIQDGVDALKEFGRLGPDLKQLFEDFKANGKTAIHDIVTVTQGLIRIVDGLGGAFGKASGEIKAMANLAVASFNIIGSSISVAMQPLRELIKVNNKVNPLFDIPQIPEFKGYQLPSPGAGINPFTPKVQGNATAPPGFYSGPGSDSSGGYVGGGGLAIPGQGLATGSSAWWPTVPQYPSGGYAVPGMPDDGKKAKLPAVPLGNNDPMSLLQGFPATAELYSAAGTVLDNQQKVAQTKSDLNTLEKANVRDEDAIVTKRNELLRAGRELHESELRLNEAKQQAVEKSLKGVKDTHAAMSELSAGLDQDLGFSKGLPGLADNLVRFLGHLAAAPLEGMLAAQVDADPHKGGYGLFGILGAQGVFGPQNTGLTQQSVATAFSGGGIPGGVNLANLPDAHGAHPQIGVLAAIAKRFGLNLTAGKDDHPVDGGYHPRGEAGDFGNGDQTAQESAFANYLAQNFGPYVTELIHSGPGTLTNIKNGQPTPVIDQPGSIYNSGQAGYHGDHDHVAVSDAMAPAFMQRAQQLLGGGFGAGADQATGALNGLASAANSATQALGNGGGAAISGSGFNWGPVLSKESSGNWANADTGGTGHYGGLQFSIPTWNAYGGGQFAPRADLATPAQQMQIADNTAFNGYGGTPPQGLGAWETIANGSTAGDGITLNSQPPGMGGGMYPGMGMPQGYPLGPGFGQVGTGTTPGLGTAAGLTPGQPGLGSSATLGGSALNPVQIGAAVAPPSGSGQGGVGMSQGGLLDMAMQAGAAGLDAMAPGAGQAASTAIKLANRAIQYGGQLAGIGASGLMETFLPTGGSDLANHSWLTKLAGGIAGAGLALPNVAGKKAEQPAQGQGQGQQGNTTIDQSDRSINVVNQRATEDGTGKDIAYHANAQYSAPGM